MEASRSRCIHVGATDGRCAVARLYETPPFPIRESAFARFGIFLTEQLRLPGRRTSRIHAECESARWPSTRATMNRSGILTVLAIFPIAYAMVEWAVPRVDALTTTEPIRLFRIMASNGWRPEWRLSSPGSAAAWLSPMLA